MIKLCLKNIENELKNLQPTCDKLVDTSSRLARVKERCQPFSKDDEIPLAALCSYNVDDVSTSVRKSGKEPI